MKRPYLLVVTALGAGASMIAHGMALTTDKVEPPAPTRLGVSIQESIADRDRKAAEQQRALELREKAAQALEARLLALQQAQPDPAAAPQPAEAPDKEEQFDNLARIYQTMKPAKAAVVFEKLDMEVQMKVAQRMRERSMAMILASMTPDGAAALSMSLANRRPATIEARVEDPAAKPVLVP